MSSVIKANQMLFLILSKLKKRIVEIVCQI